MSELEENCDGLIAELYELKRLLSPAASPETDELIAALSESSSEANQAANNALSHFPWLALPDAQQLPEILALRVKVRDKIARLDKSQRQSAARLRQVKTGAAVLLALILIFFLAWFLF